MSSAYMTSSTLARRVATRTLQAKPQYRCATTSTTSSIPNASSTPPPRRAVTVMSDTGRIPWGQLSLGEKAARTTQQSFNLGLVLLGVGLTAGVSYVLYTEVFSSESKTAVFNRCADRIKQDPRCIELLSGKEKASEIESHGEPSWSRWARNRTIASRTETDRVGTTHMHMHFYSTGPLASGTVKVHMTKRRDESDFQYHSLALDVPGHERVWLENAEKGKLDKRNQGKMFGVKWW